MRGLSHTSKKQVRKSKCSFCKDPTHQVTKCPHVPIVWKSLSAGIIPLEYMSEAHVNREDSYHPMASVYQMGQYWGSLYENAAKAIAKQESYKAKQQSKRRRTKKLCGYCKESGHTRRTCSDISSVTERLKQANRNFRTWFYQEYVEKQGLSTGAIIQFDIEHEFGGWQKSDKRTVSIKSVVPSINWDSINLFSILELPDHIEYHVSVDGAGQLKMENIRDFLLSPILLKIPNAQIKNKGIKLRTPYRIQSAPVDYAIPLNIGNFKTLSNVSVTDYESAIPFGNRHRKSSVSNVRVVSRAPSLLDSGWLDGFADEMSVIFKKFTKEQLEFFGVQDHINDWANKKV